MLDEGSKTLVDGVVREDDILEENVTSSCSSYDNDPFHKIDI